MFQDRNEAIPSDDGLAIGSYPWDPAYKVEVIEVTCMPGASKAMSSGMLPSCSFVEAALDHRQAG